MSLSLTSEAFRSLSTVLTPSNFLRIVNGVDISLSQKKIVKHLGKVDGQPFRKIIAKIYHELESQYRNEYIFKNTILRKELLDEFSHPDTIMLDEVRIGSSVVDLILLNGEIRVFEIKTDLDSLGKLDKQLLDYRTIAEKVFIVTGVRTIDRILTKYQHNNVGIILFDDKTGLETIKEAKVDTDFLIHANLFKLMRKKEYLDLISDYFGSLPAVPNTKIFTECLKLAMKIEVVEFQSMVREKLKHRGLRCPDLLASSKTPSSLKFICHTLDLSEAQYGNLYSALNRSF